MLYLCAKSIFIRIISFQNCEDDLCDVSSQSQLSYSVNTRRPIRCKPVVTRAQELAFLKVFIHRANAKVFGVSRDFKIDFWDEKIADLTSIPPEFAVGAPVTSIFSEEEYSVDLLPIIRDGINGVGSSHQQITYSSQDGIDTLLLVSVTPRMTEDVKAGVLVVAWNVTSLSDKELGRLIEAEDLCASKNHSFTKPSSNCYLTTLFSYRRRGDGRVWRDR